MRFVRLPNALHNPVLVLDTANPLNALTRNMALENQPEIELDDGQRILAQCIRMKMNCLVHGGYGRVMSNSRDEYHLRYLRLRQSFDGFDCESRRRRFGSSCGDCRF